MASSSKIDATAMMQLMHDPNFLKQVQDYLTTVSQAESVKTKSAQRKVKTESVKTESVKTEPAQRKVKPAARQVEPPAPEQESDESDGDYVDTDTPAEYESEDELIPAQPAKVGVKLAQPAAPVRGGKLAQPAAPVRGGKLVQPAPPVREYEDEAATPKAKRTNGPLDQVKFEKAHDAGFIAALSIANNAFIWGARGHTVDDQNKDGCKAVRDLYKSASTKVINIQHLKAAAVFLNKDEISAEALMKDHYPNLTKTERRAILSEYYGTA
jgi:hypothetical protein